MSISCVSTTEKTRRIFRPIIKVKLVEENETGSDNSESSGLMIEVFLGWQGKGDERVDRLSQLKMLGAAFDSYFGENVCGSSSEVLQFESFKHVSLGRCEKAWRSDDTNYQDGMELIAKEAESRNQNCKTKLVLNTFNLLLFAF